MKLLSVAPIIKGFFGENLSYFTSKEIGAGALVTVPLRNKNVPAVVISSQELKTAKADLRRADFSLKSIKEFKTDKFILPEFMGACREIAEYFLSPVGSVIKDLIPAAILENPAASGRQHEQKPAAGNFFETIIFQGDNEERIGYYRGVIREEFAKNRSVFLCAPSAADAENFFAELRKGIEKYSLLLHSGMPKKKIKELWNVASKEDHPLLLAMTRSFLSLPKENIGTLIIDKESSPFYKITARPYLDVRTAAEIIAKKSKMRLIFGDIAPRGETCHKYGFHFTQRITTSAEQEIINQEEMWKKIRETVAKKEKTILFANRRGYSPVTFCKDCFRPALCEKCDSPLVLHKKSTGDETTWLCHKCMRKTIMPEKCPYCQSWNLEEYGAGIRKIAEEAKKMFPKEKIFIMDSDAIKKEEQGEKIAKEFRAMPDAAILIGTEILFSFVDKPVDNVIIASVDPLFILPDFRINEKIFQLLIKLKLLAKKKFFIQTKMLAAPTGGPGQKVFSEVLKGNVSGFYRAEMETRKESNYPPFSLLIKITGENSDKAKLKKGVEILERKLSKWNSLNYPAFTPKVKAKYVWNLLLRIEPDSWPAKQSELKNILSSLSPAWKINVDPESLL